jgi:hypothetical protein
MRRMIKLLAIVMIVMSISLIGGCLNKSASSDNTQPGNIIVAEDLDPIPRGVKNTTLVTIDSLPSGAYVLLEDKDRTQEEPKLLGTTPLTIELPKNKEYVVWLQMTIVEYREMTRNIPEIQDRIDKFERDEKYGLVSYDEEGFFEIYSDRYISYSTISRPETLVVVRIPHRLSTMYLFGDRVRIAGIFVPSGMNPAVLLPIAGNEETYSYSKEGYRNAMKDYSTPEDLVESSFPLLTHAGVTLVIFPIETIGNERPQEMVIRISAPDPDNEQGLSEWVTQTRQKIN